MHVEALGILIAWGAAIVFFLISKIFLGAGKDQRLSQVILRRRE